MKKLIFSLHLAFLFIAMASADEKIKVGVSVPLTGNAAVYGIDVKNVIQFANDKIGGGRFELFFEDDKCEGKSAVIAAQKFINVLKVNFATGFACSSTILSAGPLYEAAKLPTVVSLASAAAISHLGSYIFRTAPNDDVAAQKLYGAIIKKHKHLGIISEQTDYAQGFVDSIEASNKRNGNALAITNENFLTETTDLRTMLLRLKNKNIEGLFINTQTELTYLNVLRQVKQLKIDLPLYGAYWPGSPALLEKADGTAEGIEFVDPPSLDQVLKNDEGSTYYNEFKSKYGKLNSVDLIFFAAFEAFRAMKEAALSGGDPIQFLKAAEFHGLNGDWSFDQNGDIKGIDFALKKIVNGKAITL